MRPRSAAKKPFTSCMCVSVEYCFGSYYDLSTWLEARLPCLSPGSCKAVFLVIRASQYFLHIFLPNFIILGSVRSNLHVINNGRLYGVFWGKRAKQQPLGCWCFVEKIHYVDNIVFILDTNHAISHLCKFCQHFVLLL